MSEAVKQGFLEGVLEQRPTLVNLQCDIDHPTQSMADMVHLINIFGELENLKGKKIAMTWAYSPSYGKPLSVPQGIIGLMTRSAWMWCWPIPGIRSHACGGRGGPAKCGPGRRQFYQDQLHG